MSLKYVVVYEIFKTKFTGSQPGIKLHEMSYVILTKTTSELLHNYRMLRRLRFPKEGICKLKTPVVYFIYD